MKREDAFFLINQYIGTKEIGKLREFLSRSRDEEWFSGNPDLLLYLTAVHALEENNGRTGLFHRYQRMEEVLSDN